MNVKRALRKAYVLIGIVLICAPAQAQAVVSFVGASAKAAATTGANPIGLPAGLAANDIVILVGTTIAGGSLSITTAGSITWFAIPANPIDVTGGEKLYAWWGRYVSGSTGPSITPGGDHSIGATFAYSGATRNARPIEVVATGTEATSDTSFSFATGLTSSLPNTWGVVIYSSGVDSNTGQGGTPANTSLTGVAMRAEYETSSGLGGGFVYADGLKAVAGTLGTWTDTMVSATAKAYLAFNIKPVTVPGAPVIGTATAGDAQATVDFLPPQLPEYDGGANIIDYTVTSTPGGFTGTGAGSPITVTGLANGTAYTFTVHATNEIGSGPESAASNSVTPVAAGSAPTVTSNFAGSINFNSANLVASISNTGGIDASQNGFAYGTVADLSTVIATTTLGGMVGTGPFNQTIGGLSAGVTYYFRAYATNTVGTGFGTIISFSTGNATPTRRMRLFEGFRVKLFSGKIKIFGL